MCTKTKHDSAPRHRVTLALFTGNKVCRDSALIEPGMRPWSSYATHTISSPRLTSVKQLTDREHYLLTQKYRLVTRIYLCCDNLLSFEFESSLEDSQNRNTELGKEVSTLNLHRAFRPSRDPCITIHEYSWRTTLSAYQWLARKTDRWRNGFEYALGGFGYRFLTRGNRAMGDVAR